MTRIFAPLWILLAFAFAGAFLGCTDGDDYLFEEGNTQEISVSAYISESLDSAARISKADTVIPGDSLIFMVQVFPSKSIRLQSYFWELDDEILYSDYITKIPVNDPGIHQMKFFLVDFFGDTLSDTVEVIAATPPVLSKDNFIPADGTQGLSPKQMLSFTWDAEDPDNLWNLTHHFILKNADNNESEILVDTLLTKPFFTYYGELSSLSRYEWTVSTENELHQAAADTIRSYLSTKGVSGENGIFGYAKLETSHMDGSLHLVLKDSSDGTVLDKLVDFTESFATLQLKPISAGTYKLFASIEGMEDFGTDTTEVELKGDRVLFLDTLTFIDSIAPTLKTLDDRDTLDFADTLKFFVTDGGGEIPSSKCKAQLEKQLIISAQLKGDTLYVPVPELKTSWTYRLLTVTVYDQSGNKTQKTFYVAPGTDFSEVFDD